MISVLIGLMMAIACVLVSWLAHYNPNKLTGRATQAGALLFGTCALCIGISLFPASQAWQEDYAVHAAQQRAQDKVNHTEQMIAALGSSRAYIEFLKAEKD